MTEELKEENTGAPTFDAMVGDNWAEYRHRVWQYAIRYLSMGWSIVPLRLDTKMAAIPWAEYQTRQPTEEEVTEWFELGVPNGTGGLTNVFGIAVITGSVSGVVVVDCDNQDALSYAMGEGGIFSMLSVETTRGQHIYMKHPGGRVGNKVGGQGVDWPDVAGLDFRGDGGLVVAPPSVKLGADGQILHTYRFNVPEAEIEGIASMLPTWAGMQTRKEVPVQSGPWSFDQLNLSAVVAKSYGEGIWEEASERVRKLGRKMVSGDGRNPWLTRYLGECVSSGMATDQAREAALAFQAAYFEVPLSPAEFASIFNSVIASDKRNHPDRYAAPEPQKAGDRQKLRLITNKTLPVLHAMGGGDRFLIDPYIPTKSIVQVVGFNGHGKSLVLLNMLWAAAQGNDFGPAMVNKKVRCLYLDHESSPATLTQRTIDCGEALGPMADDMVIWSASSSGDDMSYRTPEGVAELGALIAEVAPDVIVIDTVRQAWAGMEENSPHAWKSVNDLAMACRNQGVSVVLVHHRNKPAADGVGGREAGSTAQLKDLDVQIFVTKVVEDSDQAKREACIPNSATRVTTATGATMNAWQYLSSGLDPQYKLVMVFELAFGKVRQATENTVTAYVGMAQSQETGAWKTVHAPTPRQKAVRLHQMGRSPSEISQLVGVSIPVVRRWTEAGSQKDQEAK